MDDGTGARAVKPLDAAEFSALMAPFAPFETHPHLAVACSGGADSMALTLLADRWARGQGGAVTALIVDHALRPDSAREAAQTERWLEARGIAHQILKRTGPAPMGDVEAFARQARYRLFEEWCAASGVLHLLVAHHRDDQAETFLLRLARGSGLAGLAGMAPESARRNFRLLRPLLAVPRARLKATLAEFSQEFVEDPMNRDPVYARARIRAARDTLAAEGLTPERLAATAAHLARARAALDTLVADCLARAVALDPRGFARLDGAALRAAPEEAGLRALAALIACIGGGEFPPRLERLERLYRELPDGLAGGRTLGGCALVPDAKREGGGPILVCREVAAMAPQEEAPPGRRLFWDGRFLLTMPGDAPAGMRLGGLGAEGAAALAAAGFDAGLPALLRAGFPVLFDRQGLAAVPLLSWRRADLNAAAWLRPQIVAFRPLNALSRLGLTVV
jgi:tRNA(Ile)-lysidine synthase